LRGRHVPVLGPESCPCSVTAPSWKGNEVMAGQVAESQVESLYPS
jgi:hypothetical protein